MELCFLPLENIPGRGPTRSPYACACSAANPKVTATTAPANPILLPSALRSGLTSRPGEHAIMPKTLLLGFSVLVTVAVVLLLLYQTKVGELFHLHVRDRPKRRLLLAA